MGDRPLVRFLGSLVTPALCAVVESPGLSALFMDAGHVGFWLFSALIGGLQAMALLTRRVRLKFALEFLSTFLSVMIFIVVYFLFDVRVAHEKLVAAGDLSASALAQHLGVNALRGNLAEFFGDPTHVYVAVGGALLASALARGRAKVLRLTQRISDLFGTYVDGRVRDRIMGAEGSLAESKDVAVLFSDIRGFTPVTERSKASEVVEMLNAFFTEWDRVSRAHGGIIDKFIGDAVMIIFEPRRRRRARTGGRSVRPRHDGGPAGAPRRVESAQPPVLPDIGVGIDQGPVILRNIGSARRRNYTAVGDTVSTASRLESACKEYKRRLIVSGPVFERLDEKMRPEFTCLGEASLKGKSGGIPIYGAFPV